MAYLKRVTVFSDTVSSVEMSAAVVEIWQIVRTGYGADILPTDARKSPCKKTLLSSPSSSSLLSAKVNVGFGVSFTAEVEGTATGSVCVPTSKYRDDRSGG